MGWSRYLSCLDTTCIYRNQLIKLTWLLWYCHWTQYIYLHGNIWLMPVSPNQAFILTSFKYLKNDWWRWNACLQNSNKTDVEQFFLSLETSSFSRRMICYCLGSQSVRLHLVLLLEILLWILVHLFGNRVVVMNQCFCEHTIWQSFERASVEQESHSTTSFGWHVLDFRVWAGRTCGTWLMVAGHLSDHVLCWALHFPSDCTAAKTKRWLLLFREYFILGMEQWECRRLTVFLVWSPRWHTSVWCQLSLGWVIEGRVVQCEGAVGVLSVVHLLFSPSPQAPQPASWENFLAQCPSCFCISLFLSRNRFSLDQV